MALETETKRGIFILRAQPLHLGHMAVLEKMKQDPEINELIIGIGSSQYKNLFGNPFSKKERRIMIASSLKIDKPYKIVDIPDIHNYPHWVSYVEKLSPPFQVVYTGNTVVKQLFEEKKYKIREIERLDNISSTLIRHRIVQGQEWQDLVPEATYRLIHQFGGERRLIDLYRRYIRPVVSADLIIVYKGNSLVFVERGREPFRGFKAFAGGHFDTGFENTKETAVREAKEETGLRVDSGKVRLFGVYSDPQRDPRGPSVAAVYWTEVQDGEFKAGDDAKSIKILPFDKIPAVLAFDHKKIADDFLAFYHIKQSTTPLGVGECFSSPKASLREAQYEKIPRL